MATNLIYERADGLWAVETRNRERIAGSPVATYAEARTISREHDECMSEVRASRETTLRKLGFDYDPTD